MNVLSKSGLFKTLSTFFKVGIFSFNILYFSAVLCLYFFAANIEYIQEALASSPLAGFAYSYFLISSLIYVFALGLLWIGILFVLFLIWVAIYSLLERLNSSRTRTIISVAFLPFVYALILAAFIYSPWELSQMQRLTVVILTLYLPAFAICVPICAYIADQRLKKARDSARGLLCA